MEDDDRQVIRLRLERADDLFELPQSDLFSEHRNFLTGVDYCLSELRSRRSRRPVRIEIALPAQEADPHLPERLARTLRRYCDHRARYNGREQRALRIEGLDAFRIGLPITVVGFVLAEQAGHTGVRDAADHLGWVLAWIGLWYPFDQVLFSPLAYGRENRVLGMLRDADIVVEPIPET